MIESKYTASIHKLLPKTIYKWKINDNFQGGVPDAYYSGHGGDLWIEYKYLQKLPKRTDTLIVPQLRSLQIRWLNDRSAEGRNCLVVVGCPDGSYIFNSDTWGEGVTTEVFKNGMVTRQAIADEIVSICALPRPSACVDQSYYP